MAIASDDPGVHLMNEAYEFGIDQFLSRKSFEEISRLLSTMRIVPGRYQIMS